MSSEESEYDSLGDFNWSRDSDSDSDITNQAGYSGGMDATLTPTTPQSQYSVLDSEQEDGQNSGEPVAGTSTGSVSRIVPKNLSGMSSLLDGVKKRKNFGSSTNSPSTPTPKRCKKPSKVGGSSSNINTPSSTGGTCEDDEEENVNNGEDKHRRTSQHFSIHKLPVGVLRKSFAREDNGEVDEEYLIQAIMKEVNERQKNLIENNGRQSQQFQNRSEMFGLFEEMTAAKIPSGFGLSDEEAQEAKFDFNVLFYRQITAVKTDIKVMYGINEDSPYENIIWFYYRVGDIYALTIKQTWQLIQVYSCYDFPCQLSGRLTNTDGSTQEILFHLTGNVSASQSLKKNPMRYDKLNSVVLNVIKSLRDDCSLYGLKEFAETNRKKVQVKVQIGLGYIRIKRRMDHKNLPEILDHFTKICEGEPTYTFPDNRAEEQMDDVPYLHGISGEVEQTAKKKLYQLIKQYVRDENQELTKKFYLTDVFRDDFYSAEDYMMTCSKKIVSKFTACPTLTEVFTVIKEKWGREIFATASRRSKDTFANRIKKYIKIEYRARGSAKLTSRPLLSLLEGEMALASTDVWKLMGKWMVVREEYYYQIHVKFVGLLGKGGILRDAKTTHLIKSWDIGNITSVKDYCKQYETEKDYFLPPPPDARGMMTSGHFFDMLKVSRDRQGKFFFWMYYIFDRFDSGIRDASVRITKSLEMLFPKDGSSSNSGSLLKKFWCHQTDKLKTLFGNFESFCVTITTSMMRIVVAFDTRCQQQLNTSVSAGTATASQTLQRERKLKLDLPKDDFVKLIRDNVKLSEICGDLEISPQSNVTNDDFYKLMEAQVLDQFVKRGYFTRIVSDTEKCRYRVTGSFLKLRNDEAFKMSDDYAKNLKYSKLFREVQKLCTTGFPGFTHKLECFQIHENVTKESRMKLFISELL